MGKRGRKVVYVEVNGKKGSKTLVGKTEKVTLCNSCVTKAGGGCASLKALSALAQIEAPVYGCVNFIEVVREPKPVKVPKVKKVKVAAPEVAPVTPSTTDVPKV